MLPHFIIPNSSNITSQKVSFFRHTWQTCELHLDSLTVEFNGETFWTLLFIYHLLLSKYKLSYYLMNTVICIVLLSTTPADLIILHHLAKLPTVGIIGVVPSWPATYNKLHFAFTIIYFNLWIYVCMKYITVVIHKKWNAILFFCNFGKKGDFWVPNKIQSHMLTTVSLSIYH